MSSLLLLSRQIDWITDKFGTLAKWAVFLSCFISAGNALVRYSLDYSSNSFLEIQWYLFAACVMLGAAQVLRVNEHVRVDVFYGLFSGKGQAIIDLLGLVFFLAPVMIVMIYYSWPLFVKFYVSQEMSSNAGGLIRWPAMLTLPVGFALVLLQGVSEIIKRVAWLAHKYEGEFHYERPLQ
ncbi:TRAP transporter small permease subunit [Aquabacterium sp.]|uniref:TRAP transporter small permease subunit n=1 Tax=Aquabacterium sp. TaxID=1872578 RepID=UPI002BA536C1|nr:TRAP transporter small permease subunit [Aquabacterium sp.]HSW06725.1 TRAP transporter small permease subunit [Aquabacterium sp.]